MGEKFFIKKIQNLHMITKFYAIPCQPPFSVLRPSHLFVVRKLKPIFSAAVIRIHLIQGEILSFMGLQGGSQLCRLFQSIVQVTSVKVRPKLVNHINYLQRFFSEVQEQKRPFLG